MEGRLLRAVQEMDQYSEAAVRVGDDVKNWFEVKRSVRQRCALSP